MDAVRTPAPVRACDGCGEPMAGCLCLVLPLSEVIERLLAPSDSLHPFADVPICAYAEDKNYRTAR